MALNGRYGIGLTITAKEDVAPAAQAVQGVIGGLVSSVHRDLSRMASAFYRARAGLDVMRVGFGLLRKTFNLANTAGNLEQELAAIKAITGVSGSVLTEIEHTVSKAGMATQFSSLQAAKAFRSLAQAGMNAKEATHALNPALALAAASLGKLAPEMAAGTVNAGLKAFGMQASESTKLVNGLINMTNRFNVTVEQLPIGIGNVSRGSIALKQSMEETLISVGLMKNIAPQMSKAGTLVSSAMQRLADPTIQKMLRKLGVTYTYLNEKGKEQFLPFLDIIRNLDETTTKKFGEGVVRTGVLVKLLGKQGSQPFYNITKQLRDGVTTMNGKILKGSDAIKYMRLQFIAAQGSVKELVKLNAPKHLIDYATAVKKYGGAAGYFVHSLLNTFKGFKDLLSGAWGIFLETIGKPFMEIITPYLKLTYQGLSRVVEWLQKADPMTKRWVAGIVLAVGAATTLFGAFVASKFVLVALGAMGVLLGKIVLLTGALAVGGYALWAAWQKDVLGLRTIVTGFANGFVEGFAFVKGVWLESWPVIKAAFVDAFGAFNEMLSAFGFKGNTEVNGLKNTFVLLGQVIGGVMGFVIRAIAGAIGVVANFIAVISRMVTIVTKGLRYAGSFVGLTSAPKDFGITPAVTATAQGFGSSLGMSSLTNNPSFSNPRPFMVSAPAPNVSVSPVINVPTPQATVQINGREVARAVQEEQNDMKQRAYQAFVKENGL